MDKEVQDTGVPGPIEVLGEERLAGSGARGPSVSTQYTERSWAEESLG